PDWAKLLPDRHRKPAENAGAAVAPVQAPGKLQPLQPELFADHRRWGLLCHQRAEATAGTGAITCPISGTDDLPAWPTGQVQAGERLSPAESFPRSRFGRVRRSQAGRSGLFR